RRSQQPHRKPVSHNARPVPPAEPERRIPLAAVTRGNSSSGLCAPDHMLKAIGERFEREAHPKQVTMLHPISAGDMYGVKGIDHLAKPGLIKRIIAGSYP